MDTDSDPDVASRRAIGPRPAEANRRLLVAAIVTVVGGVALSAVVGVPLFTWLRFERHLGCTYNANPSSEGYGAWDCPDGNAYALPVFLLAGAFFAVAFAAGLVVTHRTARPPIRLANGAWMIRGAALLMVPHGLLLAGFGALPVTVFPPGGATLRNVGATMAAWAAAITVVACGLLLGRTLWSVKVGHTAGMAAVSAVLLLVSGVVMVVTMPATAWLTVPLFLVEFVFLLGGAALLLGTRRHS